ncbi:hypothetical protein [Bradyrhizobium denitrificans]|uniref:hypothetical protein n=1 Tax=Bradyrhizobium denitrificans TaxID=2734912 RepID=UPI0015553980|nr:hypothetical protein [Bradyrhizobium sp. LMG 8443]NPU23965.1 hypothetical protein [Bradyrhizobium sp. LMG 8443]
MSVEVELARANLETAESAEVVTGAQILRWLKHRPVVGTAEVLVAVERAITAVGRAKTIDAERPS